MLFRNWINPLGVVIDKGWKRWTAYWLTGLISFFQKTSAHGLGVRCLSAITVQWLEIIYKNDSAVSPRPENPAWNRIYPQSGWTHRRWVQEIRDLGLAELFCNHLASLWCYMEKDKHFRHSSAHCEGTRLVPWITFGAHLSSWLLE